MSKEAHIIKHVVKIGRKVVEADTREHARSLKRNAKNSGKQAQILRMQYNLVDISAVR